MSIDPIKFVILPNILWNSFLALILFVRHWEWFSVILLPVSTYIFNLAALLRLKGHDGSLLPCRMNMRERNRIFAQPARIVFKTILYALYEEFNSVAGGSPFLDSANEDTLCE